MLDWDGEPIELEYKAAEDGRGDDTGELDLDSIADRIGLFVCENPEGLIHAGSNLFRTGEASGEWMSIEDLDEDQEKSSVITRTLEMSNADMSTEMVNLMQTQRAFQLNSRIVLKGGAHERKKSDLQLVI